MDNKLIHKIPLKTKTTKASILTIILLISLALPLLMIPSASASATLSISPASGPNGTVVQVTGTGFAANDATGAFTVLVDGLAGKATLTGGGLVAAKQLASNAAGVVSGYFIIGGAGGLNLAPGVHSVQISDAVAAPVAVTFTITAPTVTLTPSTGPAGTSVMVSASGFPVSVTGVYTVTNSISAATFRGTAITVNVGSVTAASGTLSSNAITSGAYTGTVSLPATGAASTFTLTDSQGNTATTTYALTTPTVTLSPASGPVGTLVTATVTGFGPGATIAAVNIGNNPLSLTAIAPLIPVAPAVTEQGTSVFQFAIGAGTPNYVAGSKAIAVTDSLGNTASATFAITPTATVTLGVGATNSLVAYAPTGTANVVAFLSVTGFKASTLLTITGSPGVPAGWITFGAAATTDANGAIAVAISSGTGTAPATGVYSMTISDGTNSQTILLTIVATGNFFLISPTSGATGTTVTLTGFLAAPAATTAISFDGSAVAGATQCSANTWPTVPTTYGSFTVPSSAAGAHTVTTTGIAGTATFTNTGAPSISVVSPSSVAVGTTVTVVGSGFAKNVAVALASFSIDSISVTATVTFTSGSMIATFAMPALLAGAHSISAIDSFYNSATTSVTSTVPSVAISPTSGVVGGTTARSISITGSGFKAGQAVAVQFDTTALGAATVGCTVTNTNGGILLYTTSIAAGTLTVAGTHTITVTAGTASATATFTVVPTVSLGATAVRPGTTVTITGAGFAASSALSMTLNGTATTWYNTATTANTTTVLSDAAGSVPAAAAVIVTSATVPQALQITITDAAGNTASTTLTVLASPSLTLAAAQGIAGVGTIAMGGAGFTPGAGRAASANMISDSGVVTALTLSGAITVGATGTFSTSSGYTFTVPNVAAGTYTISLTLTLPTEQANATFTILSAASVTSAAASGKVGANITLTVVGETTITTATLGGALSNLLVTPGTTFGATASPTTGTNAYNLTTWFIVPAIPAGTYTLLVSDGARTATTTFTVMSEIGLSVTTGLKGTPVTVTGAGFGVSVNFNVTLNGAVVYNSAAVVTTTTAGGALPAGVTFTVPATATLNNSITVVDTAGNSVTKYFIAATPTLVATPASGPAGTTVQLLGSGYSVGSTVFVQVGGVIVTTSPTPITGASFIAYITIPAGTPTGNTTITATDSLNNAASTTFEVTGGTASYTVNQGTLSSTAQAVNPSTGAAQTSFARGTSVKFTFVLQTSAGSGSTVWRITLQQPDLSVLNIVSTTASATTSPSTLAYTQLIPATGVQAGTWTAQIQIFAADGATPLAVTAVTFTVT